MKKANTKREKRYKIIQKHYPGLPRPEHLYFKKIEEKIERGFVVLEIGCGRTPGYGVLESLKHISFFVGLDMDFNHLKLINKDICKPVYGDAHFEPFTDASFNVIICRSVLEHIECPEKFVQSIDRILKPGGFFIFLTPNKWSYFSVVSRLMPNKYHAYIAKKIYQREEEDTFKTFYRINSRANLKNLFEKTSLIEDEIIMRQQYPIELWFSLVLLYAGILFEKIVNRSNSLSFLRGNIIGCYRKNVSE